MVAVCAVMPITKQGPNLLLSAPSVSVCILCAHTPSDSPPFFPLASRPHSFSLDWGLRKVGGVVSIAVFSMLTHDDNLVDRSFLSERNKTGCKRKD